MCDARWIVSVALCLLSAIFAAESREAMSNTPESRSLTIDWHFDDPPERVWRAWTDPDWVARWFGSDPKGEVLRAELDARQGGRFEVSFRDSDGTQHTASGVYQHVQRPVDISFTWSWASEPGIETLVTVRLEPDGAGTKMRFTHSRLGYATTHDYAIGWRSTFAKMQTVIASSK